MIFITVGTSPNGHSGVMDERIKPTPACRSCGNPMRFARAVTQANGLPELRTYDCKDCGVAMTEAEESQVASTVASDRAPIVHLLLDYGLLVSVPEPQRITNIGQRGKASNRRRS